jgi:5-deoxy-D-glucuronate isomerase
MHDYLIRQTQGFAPGLTQITRIGDAQHDTGIAFSILKIRAGEVFTFTSQYETAILLMTGICEFKTPNLYYLATRYSFFNDTPIALHQSHVDPVEVTAKTDCEFAIMETNNDKSFPAMIYDATNMMECEQRGQGVLNNTAHRVVRTLFDIRNCKHGNLVLGEVINAPGRWSSYPPHHHLQPEIYHYRFTEPQGYGHGECGDHVFKVRQYDTYKIMSENDHAHVAAPGYGMYYIWVIRHLPDQPYIQPVFNEEHEWTRTLHANERVWNQGELP